MPDSEKTIVYCDLRGCYTISTGQKSVLTVRPVTIQVLEMEDVLFHLNSAVMMPRAPQGKSSSQGSEDDHEDPDDLAIQNSQQQMTGLGAIALAIRQFEFNPRYRILLAGHTDTSGGYAFNYELSELRAKCVMYLLTGEKGLWAENAASRHRVEDYQQIMKYFSVRRSWPCDPGKIDDAWGDDTSAATQGFFQAAVADPEEAEAISTRIRHDPQKRWHERAWEVVYDLYDEELAEQLDTNPAGMEKRRRFVRFLDDENPFVACGESFPIDDAEKNSYRSQLNRRVEILFFDDNDRIVIDCPASTTRAHTPEECPLREPDFIQRIYLDPNDMHAVAYHLRFDYYDRFKQDIMPVPRGLSLRSFQPDGTEVRSRTLHSDGVYTVVVQFPTQADADSQADHIYFTFETSDAWLFSETGDTETPPVMVTAVDRAAWDRMPHTDRPEHVCFDTLSPADRYHYYDLPQAWDSRNWTCKVSGTRDEFTAHMTTRTTESTPMVFNLDTTVLLDRRRGTQGIQDENHMGTAVDLDSSRSRVKLFCADLNTGALSLYKTGSADTTSRIPFPRNRICTDARDVKIVFFRDGFYPLMHERTVAETNWVAQGYLVGARAAVREDSQCCVRWAMQESQTALGFTGDYDLCYFHEMAVVDDHPMSYLVVYVSTSFMRDCRWADGDTHANHDVPPQSAVDRFVNQGVYNAMARYNDKEYYFDEDSEAEETPHIRPFYFFDERETFHIDDASRPTGYTIKNNVPVTRDFLAHASIQQARERAIGGKSKYLALICRDSSASSHYGEAWAWPIRNDADLTYSIFHLNASAYKQTAGPFPSDLPIREDGIKYYVFTFAHELGHATGNADEYLRNRYTIGSHKYNTFTQFFECYTMIRNRSSLMYRNGAPRIHHLVYALNKVNSEIQSGDLRTNGWLSGKRFVGKYDFTGGSFTYTRRQPGLPIPEDPRTAMHHEGKFRVRASNPRKTLYLALYYVSQDESSARRFHLSQSIEYQAVLMVRVLLSTDFSWLTSEANRANRVSSIEDAWSDLSCRYRLVNGSGVIENILIHFLTGFSHEDDAATRNYQADFAWSDSTAHPISSSGGTSDEITIRGNADGEDVVAYVLDIASKADLNNSALMVNHLDFLRQWVNARLGDTFTLEAV